MPEVTPAPACRWCNSSGERTHRRGRCIFEELARSFYDHYYRLIDSPHITWEGFSLRDQMLFATAMRLSLDPRLVSDDWLWDYVHSL